MFCGKCGAKIDTNTKFCPQCGAPLKAGGGQPGQTPAPQKADRWRSPTQTISVGVCVVSVLLMWVICFLWEKDSIAISGLSTQEFRSLIEMFGQDQNVFALCYLMIPLAAILLFVVTPVLYIIMKMILKLVSFLFAKRSGRRMPVVDYDFVSEYIFSFSSPILSGLFLIGSIVFYVLGLAGANDEIAKYNGLLKVGPTAMGWLYIMACAALAVVVVLQMLIYLRLRKERAAHKEQMMKNA